MKKAFTIQELVITMGIVGIVAALTIPAISNMLPNENESKYIKAYNSLSALTSEMLEDSTLYYPTSYDTNGNPSCYGLACDDLSESYAAGILDSTLQDFYEKSSENGKQRDTKYAVILASKMNLLHDPTFSEKVTTFTTVDGVEWEITGGVDDVSGRHKVIINTNPSDTSKKRNCIYSSTCSKPNKFSFDVSENGVITPTDDMGKVYLENSTDLRSKKKPKASANSQS